MGARDISVPEIIDVSEPFAVKNFEGTRATEWEINSDILTSDSRISD
jgi:hypothetical protein